MLEDLVRLDTIGDATSFVSNSGVSDMPFAEDFAEWLYNNCLILNRNNYNEELLAFFKVADIDGSDFGIETGETNE